MVRESWVTERWSATRCWTRSGGTPWRTCLCRTRTPRRSSLAHLSAPGCSDCSTTAATGTAMQACVKPTATTWTCRRTKRASYDWGAPPDCKVCTNVISYDRGVGESWSRLGNRFVICGHLGVYSKLLDYLQNRVEQQLWVIKCHGWSTKRLKKDTDNSFLNVFV